MDDKTNVTHSFDYAAEESKKSFLANIESINEAALLIRDRVAQAKRNNKQTIFLTVDDAGTLAKWLNNAAIALQVDYTSIDRINRKAMKLYDAGQAIEKQCTCSHLIRCDRALVNWEEYKKKKRTAA